MLDGMRDLLIGDVSPIVWQDVWTLHVNESSVVCWGRAITIRTVVGKSIESYKARLHVRII